MFWYLTTQLLDSAAGISRGRSVVVLRNRRLLIGRERMPASQNETLSDGVESIRRSQGIRRTV
jgi:hypothetical protein